MDKMPSRAERTRIRADQEVSNVRVDSSGMVTGITERDLAGSYQGPWRVNLGHMYEIRRDWDQLDATQESA